MFDNSRYLTCGVDSTIPLELQLFLWECVEHMPAPKDYLQVFELSPSGSMQSIVHSSEEPEYRKVYMIPSDAPITEKLYIIDDGDHSTMLNTDTKGMAITTTPFVRMKTLLHCSAISESSA